MIKNNYLLKIDALVLFFNTLLNRMRKKKFSCFLIGSLRQQAEEDHPGVRKNYQ